MGLIPDGSAREQKHSQVLIALGWIGDFWRRRWKPIAAAALLVFALSLGVSLSRPRKYTATAVMIIKPPSGIEKMPEGYIPPSDMGDSLYDLNSPMMIARLVDALGLQNDPEWNPDVSTGPPALFHLVRAPAARTTSPRLARERVLERLAAAISVDRRPLSNVVAVSATSGNPQRAAQMANRLVELFMEYRHERRVSENDELQSALTRRMEQLTHEAAQKRGAVEEYRAPMTQYSTRPICEGAGPACWRAEEAKRRLTELEREAKAAADMLAAFREHALLMTRQAHAIGTTVTLASRADPPARPSSPKVAMALLLSIGLGLFSGLAVGLISEILRTRNAQSSNRRPRVGSSGPIGAA